MSTGDSNSTRFYDATLRWQQHHLEGNFGAPLEERFIGIVAASRDVATEDQSLCEYEFTSEAEQILERSRDEGYGAEICIGEDRDRVSAFVGDRAITDLVFIGHGHLSRLLLGNDQDFSWYHLARSLDHLKQGFVIQRFCGGAWDSVSIALGTFAVSDMRNIRAPVNKGFEPKSIDDTDADSTLTQVYEHRALSFQELLDFSEKVTLESRKLNPPQLREYREET